MRFVERIYFFKCYFQRRNTVKMKSVPITGVSSDEAIVHAAFQILCDFVEKESPPAFVDQRSFVSSEDQEYNTAWNELKKIYAWWKERSNRRDPLDGVLWPENYDPYSTEAAHVSYRKLLAESELLNQKWYHEDTIMVMKLVSLRKFLH